MDSDPIVAALFEGMRNRITRVFPDQIRTAIASLTDEQIWWRPNESSNSVGNLVLHLTGSLNHYLNRQLGGIAYERDRAAEFNERTPVPRHELLARFDEMVANAVRTLEAISVSRLGDASPDPGMNRIVAEDILGVVTHVSTHAGQILWIAKMFRDGAIDEVWMRTHREHIWRPKSEA
jgi:uncharacterized damage-inducible protein DinB